MPITFTGADEALIAQMKRAERVRDILLHYEMIDLDGWDSKDVAELQSLLNAELQSRV